MSTLLRFIAVFIAVSFIKEIVAQKYDKLLIVSRNSPCDSCTPIIQKLCNIFIRLAKLSGNEDQMYLSYGNSNK